MWHEGVIGIQKGKDSPIVSVHYWMKCYKLPSKYGIEGGRISKLMLKIGDEIVANYDRGWDICPTTKEAELALCILLNRHN